MFNHHLGGKVFDHLWEDAEFGNLMTAGNGSIALGGAYSTSSGQMAVSAGDIANGALSLNDTAGLKTGTTVDCAFSAVFGPPEPFYNRGLPREVFISLIISMLEHCWYVWLEKIFPARPRCKGVVCTRGEKIVKKWSTPGSVHRAPLNWSNTFLKWVLDLTVGRWACFNVGYLLRTSFNLQSPELAPKSFISVSSPSSLSTSMSLMRKSVYCHQLARCVPLRVSLDQSHRLCHRPRA